MSKEQFDDFSYEVYIYISNDAPCDFHRIALEFDDYQTAEVAKAVKSLEKQGLVLKDSKGNFYPTPARDLNHEIIIEKREKQRLSKLYRGQGIACEISALMCVLFCKFWFSDDIVILIFRIIAIGFIVAGIILYVKGDRMRVKKKRH